MSGPECVYMCVCVCVCMCVCVCVFVCLCVCYLLVTTALSEIKSLIPLFEYRNDALSKVNQSRLVDVQNAKCALRTKLYAPAHPAGKHLLFIKLRSGWGCCTWCLVFALF